MSHAVASDFGTLIALRIEASQQLLALRWLDELKRVVPVAVTEIFPGDELLGQIPSLVQELARSLRAPEEETIAANAVTTAVGTNGAVCVFSNVATHIVVDVDGSFGRLS